jgi:hypothetical protein
VTDLWEPTRTSDRTSPGENRRVRELYLVEKARILGRVHSPGHKCRKCGDFRGDLARDWVKVAEKAGLRVPGAEARRPLREGETEEERRVDAARTRIRQLEAGLDQMEWVLVGIEATIADRLGFAYPAGAYQTQGTLI